MFFDQLSRLYPIYYQLSARVGLNFNWPWNFREWRAPFRRAGMAFWVGECAGVLAGGIYAKNLFGRGVAIRRRVL
jgi:hypothetical protein